MGSLAQPELAGVIEARSARAEAVMGRSPMPTRNASTSNSCSRRYSTSSLIVPSFRSAIKASRSAVNVWCHNC